MLELMSKPSLTREFLLLYNRQVIPSDLRTWLQLAEHGHEEPSYLAGHFGFISYLSDPTKKSHIEVIFRYWLDAEYPRSADCLQIFYYLDPEIRGALADKDLRAQALLFFTEQSKISNLARIFLCIHFAMQGFSDEKASDLLKQCTEVSEEEALILNVMLTMKDLPSKFLEARAKIAELANKICRFPFSKKLSFDFKSQDELKDREFHKLGETFPLLVAVIDGDEEKVEEYLSDTEIDVNAISTHSKSTALHIGIDEKRWGIVQILINFPKVKIGIPDVLQNTALHLLCSISEAHQTKEWETALRSCFKKALGETKTVSLPSKARGRPDRKMTQPVIQMENQVGLTAIELAAVYLPEPLVHELITQAKIHASFLKKLDRSVLTVAISGLTRPAVRLARVRFLVEILHCPVDGRDRITSDTAFMVACIENDLTLVRYLVSQGVDYKQSNRLGNNALHCITLTAGQLPLIKYLVEELDFSYTKPNKHGETPEQRAQRSGNSESFNYFQEHRKRGEKVKEGAEEKTDCGESKNASGPQDQSAVQTGLGEGVSSAALSADLLVKISSFSVELEKLTQRLLEKEQGVQTLKTRLDPCLSEALKHSDTNGKAKSLERELKDATISKPSALAAKHKTTLQVFRDTSDTGSIEALKKSLQEFEKFKTKVTNELTAKERHLTERQQKLEGELELLLERVENNRPINKLIPLINQSVETKSLSEPKSLNLIFQLLPELPKFYFEIQKYYFGYQAIQAQQCMVHEWWLERMTIIQRSDSNTKAEEYTFTCLAVVAFGLYISHMQKFSKKHGRRASEESDSEFTATTQNRILDEEIFATDMANFFNVAAGSVMGKAADFRRALDDATVKLCVHIINYPNTDTDFYRSSPIVNPAGVSQSVFNKEEKGGRRKKEEGMTSAGSKPFSAEAVTPGPSLMSRAH